MPVGGLCVYAIHHGLVRENGRSISAFGTGQASIIAHGANSAKTDSDGSDLAP
jgi:hypothetical protein